MGISDDVICASLGPNGYAFYGPDGHTARYAPWAEGVGNAQYYPFVSEKKNNLTQEKLLSLVLIQTEARTVSQSELEELLRKRLQQLGVSIETSTELIDFEQLDDKIVARIRAVSNGEVSPGIEELVECFVIIAADGARGIFCHGLRFKVPSTDDFFFRPHAKAAWVSVCWPDKRRRPYHFRKRVCSWSE